MDTTINRRQFILGMLAAPLSTIAVAGDMAGGVVGDALQSAGGDAVGSSMLAWAPGFLDIHHIATGRGNATFVIMPDGTSLLIDAGATADGPDTSAAPRPNAQRRPGEWIGRYVQRHLRATKRAGLDYVLVTHLHPDHTGDVNEASPLSAQGAYQLSGITDVAEIVPVATLIDRAYPGYDYPVAPNGRFASNYLAFVQSRIQTGQKVERFMVGRNDQFTSRNKSAENDSGHRAGFDIRNLAANGQVWTGKGEQARMLFPALNTLTLKDYPNENVCSTAIRIGYGNFAYFTAGDLTSYTFDGDAPWRDVLTAAARASGPVDVSTADHHGMFDGISADSVRILRPKAWIIPSWHISHPDQLQLERMFSERLYPGKREVFATSIMHENFLANRRLISRLSSRDGHVIVRVAPGGKTFTILVTDNTDEEDRIKLKFGPYLSGSAS